MAIYRITCTGVAFGQTMQNVLHFNRGNGFPTAANMAISIRDVWLTNLARRQGQRFTWTMIQVQSVENPLEVGTNLPIAIAGALGGGTVNLHPFACALLKIQTATGGRTGRGRIYVPLPGLENYEDGFMSIPMRTAWNDQFLSIVRPAYLGAASEGFNLGIISKADPLAFKPATSLDIRNTSAVQRRRGMGIGI